MAKRAPFPNKLTGFKGYINRTMWIIQNPLYGYNKLTGIKCTGGEVTIKGNPDISDKYKISGWMWATYTGKSKAFEFYAVLPHVTFASG